MGLIRGGGAYAAILPGMIEEPGSTRDMSAAIAGVIEFANQTRHRALQILQAVADSVVRPARCNRTRSSSPAGCAAA